MKRIINRIVSQGVNFVQYMGAYYSLSGLNKLFPGCYPPSHSYNNKLFAHYHTLSDYIAKKSYLCSKTTKTAKTLILHPGVTSYALSDAFYKHVWTYTISDFEESSSFRQTDATFAGIVNSLTKLNKGFEIGFEPALLKAKEENGKIVFGDTAYEIVILPAVLYTRKETKKMLDRFVKNGGKLILVNGIPEKDIDNFEQFDFKALLGEKYEDILKAIGDVKDNPNDYKTYIFNADENIIAIASNETALCKDGLLNALSESYKSFGVKRK